MAFSVEKYLFDTFNLHDRNCWHFACDVWADLTGKRLHASIEDFHLGALHGYALRQSEHLKQIPAPKSPCLVLMQRQRIQPHVGVYVNGKLLHLKESGAAYVDLQHVTALYPTTSFYQNP
jgi:hypothetical protein